MNLHNYQGAIHDFARYPHTVGPRYCAMGLFGEAGEIANQVKKIWRDDAAVLTQDRIVKLRDELGDVLWYAVRWAHHQNVVVGTMSVELGAGVPEMGLDAATDIFEATEHLALISAAAMGIVVMGSEAMISEYVQALLNTIATVADFLETDIEEVAQANVDKLTGRVERGTLGGSGDGR